MPPSAPTALDREPSTPISVATWNVNGIRARQTEFADWAARTRPDVICLQELKATPEQVPQIICRLDGYASYWHGEPGAIGQRPEERALLDALLARDRGDLRDVGRALAPDDDRLFTWWAPWRNLRQRNIGWRIDYVLASPVIA